MDKARIENKKAKQIFIKLQRSDCHKMHGSRTFVFLWKNQTASGILRNHSMISYFAFSIMPSMSAPITSSPSARKHFVCRIS